MRRICQLFIVEPPTPFRDTEGLALDLYGSCVVAERRGTPVLAYRAGAVEEVIDQGVTGMIVDNIDQARIASVQVAALDRRKVRRRFEERFTARRMASDYVRVYRKLVHAVARPRDVKYQTNGGARIGEEELIRNVITHAD
jgi:glycosyltransferase involved in cell wall biosynthesis